MFHYTYQITVSSPTDSRRRYIGVRSCKCRPEDDVRYFGSCRSFTAWQKENGCDGLVKDILAVWPTRKMAVAHEVLLHNEHDVSHNSEFFNRAKQTNTKFDTSGTAVHSEESRKRISMMFAALPRTESHKEKISAALKGRTRSKEWCEKISVSRKGKPSPHKGKSLGKGVQKSEAHKAKIGAALTGKKRSAETIDRMRRSRIGIVPKRNPEQYANAKCPHCSKTGMKANMTRYHFNNCKSLTSAGA